MRIQKISIQETLIVQRVKLVLFLAVLLFGNTFVVQRSEAFPNNMIVTTIGCMTDLSTDEVIMNNQVKSAAESDFPNMHLVVLDAASNQNNNMVSPYHYSETELHIVFINPYSHEEFPEDLQFIMEVEGPASFVHGGTIGCDGDKRVAARLIDFDGKVVLKVNDPAATLRVWGGWATGQNPVRLTPDLILQPATETAKAEEKREKTEAENLAASGTEAERTLEDNNSNEKDESPALQNNAGAAKTLKNTLLSRNVPDELDSLKNGQHENAQIKIAHNKGEPDVGVGGASHREIIQKIKEKQLDLMAEKLKRKPVATPDHDSATDDGNRVDDDEERNKRQRELDRKRRESEKKMQEHRVKLETQMKKNFSNARNKLDMTSHLIGCGFYLLCIGGILIWVSKKRDKGRRDL